MTNSSKYPYLFTSSGRLRKGISPEERRNAHQERIDQHHGSDKIICMVPIKSLSHKIKHHFKCCGRKKKVNCASLYKHGCNNCSAKKAAAERRLIKSSYNEKLAQLNILCIAGFIDNDTACKHQCLIQTCKEEWEAAPVNVLSSDGGCPGCKSKKSWTKNDHLILIAKNNAELLHGGNTKEELSKYRCLLCEEPWSMKASAWQCGHKCPNCYPRGVNSFAVFKDVVSNFYVIYGNDKMLTDENFFNIENIGFNLTNLLLIEHKKAKFIVENIKLIYSNSNDFTFKNPAPICMTDNQFNSLIKLFELFPSSKHSNKGYPEK